ncbi:unnamed protein product, partial [Mesorhabditis spiculigera]
MDINLFGIRIREWASYHYPELYKIVGDQYKYKSSKAKKRFLKSSRLLAHLWAWTFPDLDLMNIERFAARVASLTEYRQRLHGYIKDRMHSCAPSLSALVGEQVGARLISHAGSLTNLAKFPRLNYSNPRQHAQVRTAVPLTFIGRAAAKNKGRISRFLANKFPSKLSEKLRAHKLKSDSVTSRPGEVPAKNIDVMKAAEEEAVGTCTKEEADEPPPKKKKKSAVAGTPDEEMENDEPDELFNPMVLLAEEDFTEEDREEIRAFADDDAARQRRPYPLLYLAVGIWLVGHVLTR